VTVAAPVPAPEPVVPLQRPDEAKANGKPRKSPVATEARSREDADPMPPPAVAAAPSDAEPAPATVAEPITNAPAVEPTPTPDAAGFGGVTITGCLETSVDGVEFRLIDIEGADAPKARSWQSAFLKKRAAPVALVEVSDPKGMQKYVGSRVVATGQLTRRELHLRSLRPAGSSCN
jgi:hypothetical protein